MATFRAEPDLATVALATQLAFLTIERIAELGRRQRDAVERIGRLHSEVDGQRSRAEFEAIRAAMESAQAEADKERARTADQLRSDAEGRANVSEESLKLANEVLTKLEAELEGLKQAKEKSESEASAAFEAGKSTTFDDYIEEVPKFENQGFRHEQKQQTVFVKMVLMKRKHEELEIKKSVYGDGNKWFRGSIIGKSSSGPVYLATLKKPKWRLTHLPVLMAVKSAEVSDSALLQREALVLRNFHACPYIYRCFGEEVFTSDRNRMVYNLLLEYGSSGTLADVVKKTGGNGLPESDVRRYTRYILEGLDCVHSAGYVHRALKPENIIIVPIITSTGTEYIAKIGDFGLAKKSEQARKIFRMPISYKQESRALRSI
ncbi:calcium-dependent protein kinase 4-like [Camellia sinensis]|uniref:calcium-dependent protein kinase 4-like n=1 Tax=Camellia sinensis TaxID=4442 RepID=UPI00103618FB|nr:calcium-dependent protein kinase 4-like [Camellia sinensis]